MLSSVNNKQHNEPLATNKDGKTGSKNLPVFHGQQRGIVHDQELIFHHKVVISQEREECPVIRRQLGDIPTGHSDQRLQDLGQVPVVVPHTLDAESFATETGPPQLDAPGAPDPDVGHLQRSGEALANRVLAPQYQRELPADPGRVVG